MDDIIEARMEQRESEVSAVRYRVSYQRMAELYRAMNNEMLPSDRTVTIGDIVELEPAETFDAFLLANAHLCQYYDDPGREEQST
jgi:hypothetical protein